MSLPLQASHSGRDVVVQVRRIRYGLWTEKNSPISALVADNVHQVRTAAALISRQKGGLVLEGACMTGMRAL